MCMKSLEHFSIFLYLFFFIWGILNQSWTEIEDSILVVGYVCGALVVFVAIFWGRNFFRNRTWQLWTQPLKFWKPRQKNKWTLKKLLQNAVEEQNKQNSDVTGTFFMGVCGWLRLSIEATVWEKFRRIEQNIFISFDPSKVITNKYKHFEVFIPKYKQLPPKKENQRRWEGAET